MLACPFHIPRYEWDKTAPFMRKCSMCAERIAQGKLPACVEACPQEVMTFGERSDLLRSAQETIRAKPGRYLPRVWGENEFGGTSILFISDVDLDSLGFPEQGAVGIPELTEPLISKTPYIGLSVCFGAWALSAIIERRNRLMGGRAAAGSDKDLHEAEDGD
jgi:formate dehydrogenase iron-sulfur subunit